MIKTVNGRHYPKQPKRLPRPLSADIVKKVFAQLPDNWFGMMHRLALATGVRVSEALNCLRSSIDMDAMTIRVVGMSDKERIVYFSEAFRCILINYIEQHPAEKGCDLLFQHDGQGYSFGHFVREIRTFCKRIGIKYVFRQLRYTFATELIKAGMKVEALQQILGYESIATTMIMYLNMVPSLEQIRSDYFKAFKRQKRQQDCRQAVRHRRRLKKFNK